LPPNQSPYAEHVQHAWTGALVCSAFRNEGRLATDDVDWDEIWPSEPAGSSGHNMARWTSASIAA
jgi:hypothetical protein